MDQLARLWQYQQADMDVERFERELRKNPDRIMLKKHRDFILEQQNVVKRIEEEVLVMSDRMEAIEDEVVRLRESLTEVIGQVQGATEASIDDIDTWMDSTQKLLNTISRYEAEMSTLRKDADAKDRQQHEVRLKAARIKTEFDQVKERYDAFYQEKSVELNRLKAIAQEAGKGIDTELMDKYNAIKNHSIPPMTKLSDDRCGGCNMSLPAVTLNKIRSGIESVDCENCGRIIWLKGEGA